MPFSFSVPAFLSTRARCAFRTSRQPVARRSGAAAVLASIVAIAAASLTTPASGNMVVSYEDTAGGLKISYTGSLDVSTSGSSGTLNSASIYNDGTIGYFRQISGLFSAVAVERSNFTRQYPGSFFAADLPFTSTTSDGSFFGVYINDESMTVYLPSDYGGESIDGSATFSGLTIADSGVANQVFTFTAGAPGNLAGQTITFQGSTVNSVPEPSTWALGAFALACGGWQLTRRRRARRVKA